MGTITSANVSIVLNVPDVFSTGQTIQGFAVDDAFTAQAYDIAETRMGVDGVLSAGYTPQVKPFAITLQPDSSSISVFDTWGQAEVSAKEKFEASMSIHYPSVGKVYTFNVGWLKNFKALADAKKVLDPQTYTIDWQDITSAPDGN